MLVTQNLASLTTPASCGVQKKVVCGVLMKALKTQKVAFLDFNLTGCAITCRPCKLDMNLIIYKLKNGSASKQLSKPCLDLIMFISIKHVIFIFQLFVLVYVMLLKIQRGR